MISDSHKEKIAVVLAGHGVPATDCPPQFIAELMAMEWGGDCPSPSGAAHANLPEASKRRAAELEAKVRHWPRRDGNDPYKEGLEKLAEVLKPLLPGELFAIGYNEFCAPSIPEALELVIEQGATRILVISTMLTPGGVHSQIDIPRHIDGVAKKHPEVKIEYVWPFDLQQVAGLLAQHVKKTV